MTLQQLIKNINITKKQFSGDMSINTYDIIENLVNELKTIELIQIFKSSKDLSFEFLSDLLEHEPGLQYLGSCEFNIHDLKTFLRDYIYFDLEELIK